MDQDYFCSVVVADTHVFPALRKWNRTGIMSAQGEECLAVQDVSRRPSRNDISEGEVCLEV